MTCLKYFLAHYIKVKKILLAAGLKCEVCRREFALDNLMIHTFISEEEAEIHSRVDLEEYLLVVCFRCHDDIHEFNASFQEEAALVMMRQEEIRSAIREILAYTPKPIQPPDSDLEEAYRDACSSRFRFGT